jgi:hypothetical protein
LALTLLDRLPRVFDALRAGEIDVARAKVFCDEVDLVDADTARKIAAGLLDGGEARRCTTGQLRARIRRLVATVDPDAVRARYAKSVAQRGVDHVEYANGTAMLSGFYLPKEKAAAAWEHLDRLARAGKAAGGESRTLGQLRADIFADLLAGVAPAVAGYATAAERPGTIHLHIGWSTLTGLGDLPGEIDGFGPVLADIARQTATQMAQRARWRFTVTAPDGSPLAEGPLRHRPTAAQIGHVRARDVTCRAPGCQQPATRCDLDHIHDRAFGGVTTLDNLCCLCKAHHRLKHEGGFHPERTTHGITWTTPRGHHYTVVPDTMAVPGPIEHALADYLDGHHGPSHLRR